MKEKRQGDREERTIREKLIQTEREIYKSHIHIERYRDRDRETKIKRDKARERQR